MTITIKTELTAEELAVAFAIRVAVFAAEQGIPAELDQDGQDESGRHVLAFVDGVPVGTGRITPAKPGQAQLSRIAVLGDYRNQGLGQIIVNSLEKLAVSLDAITLILYPHHYLEPFYEALGYQRIAGSDSIAGHQLITMIKNLDATPLSLHRRDRPDETISP